MSLKLVPSNERPTAPAGWENALKTDKNGNPRAGLYNPMLILENDPETRDLIRFNDLSKEIDVSGGRFAGVEQLDSEATAWLECKYDLTVSSGTVGDALLTVATRHKYDPLRDYLRGVAWDGVKRIDDFLLRLGAVVDGDRTEHFRRLSRRWFIMAVSRALEPGCQADTVLVLRGRQGSGKSSALRALGGPYFTDTEVDLRDKDAKLILAGSWLVEIAELASLRHGSKAANGAITSRVDRLRPPYGKKVKAYPRRSVLVGTTNDDIFLSDPTGHRRWWIVPLDDRQIDIAAIEGDRDQLWAEAVAAYDIGERHHLVGEEARAAEDVAGDHAEDLPFVDSIRTWWLGLPPKERPKSGTMPWLPGRNTALTTSIVAFQALSIGEDRITQEQRTQIGIALRHLGFKCRRPRDGARRARTYTASEEMIKDGLA